jgi:sugar lactone lactonase YvrE
MRSFNARRLVVWSTRAGAGVLALLAATTGSVKAAPPSFAPNHLFVGAQDRVSSEAAVFEFDEDGSFVRKITVDPGGSDQEIRGLTFGPDGALYAAEPYATQVRRIDGSLGATTVLGAGDGVGTVTGIAFGPDGYLYVANRDSGGTVLSATLSGEIINSYTAPAGTAPSYITFGPEGHLFVTTYDTTDVANGPANAIQELDADLRFVQTIGSGTFTRYPANVVFSQHASAFVSDYGANAIRRIGLNGQSLGTLDAAGLSGPDGATIGPDGNLYVSNRDAGNVLVVDPRSGSGVRTISHPDLKSPAGLAFAPFRFKANVKGTVVAPDSAQGDSPPVALKLAEVGAVVSVSPGSGTVMLSVTDGASSADIASAFPGTAALVFHGSDVAAADGRSRVLQGASVQWQPRGGGASSLAVVAKGARGVNGFFVPTSLSGSLHHGNLNRALVATLRATKRLP